MTIITLPDNYTLAAIGGIALIAAAWIVILWRRRKPKEKAVKSNVTPLTVDNSARIADALERIARSLTVTGGGGDVAARAEALAKQFEASAEIGISVGLPPVMIAKMIRQSVLQEKVEPNEEAKVQPA
jgi:hypothetical protein